MYKVNWTLSSRGSEGGAAPLLMKRLDINVLSQLFLQLDYKTLTKTAQFVCKKWYRAFHTHIVYQKLDQHFVDQTNDETVKIKIAYKNDKLFDHFNTVCLAMKTWWKEIVFIKDWIAYSVACCRTKNNAHNTPEQNMFTNIFLIEPLFSGNKFRENVLTRGIHSDMKLIKEMNTIIRQTSLYDRFTKEEEISENVKNLLSSRKEQLDPIRLSLFETQFRYIYEFVVHLLKIKLKENIVYTSSWLYLVSQNVDDKCSVHKYLMPPVNTISSNTLHSKDNTISSKIINMNNTRKRVQSQMSIYCLWRDSNVDILLTNPRKLEGLCSKCLRAISWSTKKHIQSYDNPVIRLRRHLQDDYLNISIDQTHKKIYRTEECVNISQIPHTSIELLVSKYQNEFLKHSESFKMNPQYLHSCMHDAHGFQEQCKEYYKECLSKGGTIANNAYNDDISDFENQSE